jgi:hypothetical protein
MLLRSEEVELCEAKGDNPNPCFFVHKPSDKIVKSGPVTLLSLRDTYVFDFETSEGCVYELNGKVDSSREK